MKKKSIKTISLDEITDRYIGKRGTAKREVFEQKLLIDLSGNKKRELL